MQRDTVDMHDPEFFEKIAGAVKECFKANSSRPLFGKNCGKCKM